MDEEASKDNFQACENCGLTLGKDPGCEYQPLYTPPSDSPKHKQAAAFSERFCVDCSMELDRWA